MTIFIKNIQIIKNKIIFIAALDWGLGHATRCVPLISQLKQDNAVIIGTTPSTALIFDEEFPDLKKLPIEPYNISYSKRVPLNIKLLFDSPRIKNVIRKEQKQLANYVREYKIDVVISDNRFGLHHSKTQNIYITHQLNIKAGLFSSFATSIHHSYIKHFNEVWIPDFEKTQDALAGDLSRNNKRFNVKYIGPLTRLKINYTTIENFDYLCLLSGPEPQRSILEGLLMQRAIDSNKKICLVRGTNKKSNKTFPKHVAVIDVPTAEQLSMLITNSKKIICRSGYSTLMDLYCLKKSFNAILVPTPGQSEQEYLAEYWKGKFGSKVILQENIHMFDYI